MNENRLENLNGFFYILAEDNKILKFNFLSVFFEILSFKVYILIDKNIILLNYSK